MHGALRAGGIQTNLGTGRTELLSPLISRSRSLQTPGASLRDLLPPHPPWPASADPLPHWAVPSRLSWGLQPCFCEPGGEVQPSSVEVWLHLQARVQRPVSLGGPRGRWGAEHGEPSSQPLLTHFFFFFVFYVLFASVSPSAWPQLTTNIIPGSNKVIRPNSGPCRARPLAALTAVSVLLLKLAL